MVHGKSRYALGDGGSSQTADQRNSRAMNTSFDFKFFEKLAEMLAGAFRWDEVHQRMLFCSGFNNFIQLRTHDSRKRFLRSAFWITESDSPTRRIDIDPVEVSLTNSATGMKADREGQLHPGVFFLESFIDSSDVFVAKFRLHLRGGSLYPHLVAWITLCDPASNSVAHYDAQDLQICHGSGFDPSYFSHAPVDKVESVLVGKLSGNHNALLGEVSANPLPGAQVSFAGIGMAAMGVDESVDPSIPFFNVLNTYVAEFVARMLRAFASSKFRFLLVIRTVFRGLHDPLAVDVFPLYIPVRRAFSFKNRSHSKECTTCTMESNQSIPNFTTLRGKACL